MSKTPSPIFQIQSSARCLGGCIFPVPEEIVYSFFNILLNIFWDSINLAYVSKLEEESLVYDYILTSQRESHSVPDIDIFPTLCLFCLIWSYRE